MNGCSKNTDGSSKKIDTVVAFISMVEAFPLYGGSISVNDCNFFLFEQRLGESFSLSFG